MKFKIRLMTLFLFIFVSSGAFAQYKYDIGIKASTDEMERFQLEARFHLKSPYSLVANVSTGTGGYGQYWQTALFNDSLLNIGNDYYQVKNNMLKLGVQRKLGFLATEVFYVGASLGVGFQQYKSGHYLTTYAVRDSAWTNPPSIYEHLDQIDYSEYSSTWRSMSAQLAVSFGMDVPISKRFSINAEIGMMGIYTNSLISNYSTINILGAVSGGLRYQFGKRE